MYNEKAIKRYEEGRILHQKGRLSDAERAYKKALKINPNFVEALNNLGNVFVDKGRLTQASDAFRKALKFLPDNPMLLNNLGNAMQLSGENEVAIGWFNKAIAQNPKYADAHTNLGNAMRSLEKYEEATESYRNAIRLNGGMAESYFNLGSMLVELRNYEDGITNLQIAIDCDPGYADAYCELGNAYYLKDETDQAIASYNKALQIAPANIYALVRLGIAFQTKGMLDRSISALQRAIAIDPDNVEALLKLAAILGKQGELETAVDLYRKLIKLEPENAQVYKELGTVLDIQGEYDEAIRASNTAIEIDPDDEDAYRCLGEIYSNYGEMEQALVALRKAIDINPEYIRAYRILTKNKKFTEADEDVVAMEKLYVNPEISDWHKMQLSFSLGKVYEDVGEYEKAMNFILEATGLMRASFEYSSSQSEQLFRQYKETYSSQFFASRKSVGIADETLIFIVGMPRSGTSLVEQILASHSCVYGAGEILDLRIVKLAQSRYLKESTRPFPESVVDLNSASFAKLGSEYITRIRKFSKDATRITNKMPHNFLNIGFIKLILPNAKIIHCRRNPMDNCLSVFKNYFPPGHDYSYDLTELGQYYNLYLDLMEHWRITLPGFFYDQDYEMLVEDQENQTRKMLEFCDLPWEDACIKFYKTHRKVKTLSNAQVRQPIYKDSVELWKRYEQQLKPLANLIYK